MAEGPSTSTVFPSTWVVLGAGGHARVVTDVIQRLGGAVAAVAGSPVGPPWPVPVLAGDEAAVTYAAQHRIPVALGVGDNRVRERLLALCAEAGIALPPIVAATATLAPDATLGAGTVVLEHAHVGPSSRLGSGVVVNTAAVVEHDCVVGDGVHLAPACALLGASRVGYRSLVGSGARVLPGVGVGAGCVVGAGAVVREDVADGTTVAGVPATVVGR